VCYFMEALEGGLHELLQLTCTLKPRSQARFGDGVHAKPNGEAIQTRAHLLTSCPHNETTVPPA